MLPLIGLLAASAAAELTPENAGRLMDGSLQREPVAAQPRPPLPSVWEQIQGSPLRALASLKSRESEYLASDPSGYRQALASLHSYLGQYEQAVASFDQVVGPSRSRELRGRAGARPAVDAVFEAAGSRRVLLINEAHHVPMHRAFVIGLLQGLKDRGFRYFAAETLDESDRALPRRGYPSAQTGYYLQEPLYAELVREAMRLGYEIVPYEDQSSGCKDPPDDPLYCMNRRDRLQAENLKARVFDKDPGAKILVHAGFSHIKKRTENGWVHMAQSLEAITGIEPFSIDQVELSPRSTPAHEPAAYREALALHRPTAPLVLTNRDGSYWVMPEFRGVYDVQVLHPRSRELQGRPTWATAGGRVLVQAPRDACAAVRPCLLQAFRVDEGPDALPSDQVTAESERAMPALALKPGRYRLLASDAGGKTLSETALTAE